jgi:UTP-glucose-1-phosphate uridylyltransferase
LDLGKSNWRPYADQQAILGIFRLLLKLDVAELGKNGRMQFTDSYRSKLFESQEKARLAYQGSKIGAINCGSDQGYAKVNDERTNRNY